MVLAVLTVVGGLLTGTGIGGLAKIYGQEYDKKVAGKEAEAKAKAKAELEEQAKIAREMNAEISYAKIADIQLELYAQRKAEAEIKDKIKNLGKELNQAIKDAVKFEAEKTKEQEKQ